VLVNFRQKESGASPWRYISWEPQCQNTQITYFQHILRSSKLLHVSEDELRHDVLIRPLKDGRMQDECNVATESEGNGWKSQLNTTTRRSAPQPVAVLPTSQAHCVRGDTDFAGYCSLAWCITKIRPVEFIIQMKMYKSVWRTNKFRGAASVWRVVV
jgi:hypothetical protein